MKFRFSLKDKEASLEADVEKLVEKGMDHRSQRPDRKTRYQIKAEEKIFDVSDNYSSYIYWTARSFIRLSDVYVAKDNIFQAKETLKSVIENYPNDDDNYNEVVNEAQSKLNIINKESNE